MQILARQLTLDLYNCDSKRIINFEEIKNTVQRLIGSKPRLQTEVVDEGHFSVVGISSSGHIVVHVYIDLRYVAVDIFTCTENTEPEELATSLRKFFQPDKIKSTFLKRGDFGLEKDIKPKIKTRVAPLRRVRNAGAKVVKKLVRGDKK